MRAIVLLVAAALLAASPVLAQDAPTAAKRGEGRRLMEAGKKAFGAKQYEQAAELFGQAYEADPSQTIALYNRAFALRKAQKYGDAVAAYQAFLEVVPGDLDAIYGLAEAQRLAGDKAGATKSYREYVDRENRAKRRRHVDRARQQLAALGAEVGPDLDGMFADGLKLHRQKKYREAAKLFAKIYTLDDARLDALYRQALALRRAGDLPEARTMYRKFLTKKVDDPDAIYGLAETERLSGNAKEAIRHFEKYISIEQRPSEQKYVQRAKEYIKLLRGVPEEEEKPAPKPEPVAEPKPEPPAAEEPAEPAPPPVEEPPAPAPAPGGVEIPNIPGHGPSPSHAAVLGRAVSVRKLVQEGRAALTGGDVDLAHERFALAASMAPDDEAVAAARDAVQLAQAGGGARQQAGTWEPPPLDDLLAEGDAARKDGRLPDAITAYQRARAAYPGSARPLWALAETWEDKGDARAARHHYQLYVDMDAPDKRPDLVDEARWKLAQP